MNGPSKEQKWKGQRELEKLASTDLMAPLGPSGGLYSQNLTGTWGQETGY